MTDITAAWRTHRPYLVNLAYQMLGDVGGAEDVAQEAFLRLSRTEEAAIDDVRGWLTVVAGRLCLDQLRSARVRLETILAPEHDVEDQRAGSQDPADRVTLDDEVSSALLEVLRSTESGGAGGVRAARRVRGALRRDRRDGGQAGGHVSSTGPPGAGEVRRRGTRSAEVVPAEHQHVTEAFITACANGDLETLAALLDATVWGVGTVLADPAPPQQVNHGPHDVAVNLLRYLGPGAIVVGGPPGEPVLLAFDHGRLFAVVVLTIRDGKVLKIEATADPSARFGADQP